MLAVTLLILVGQTKPEVPLSRPRIALPVSEKNVLGEPLTPCSQSPKTGYYRTGTCSTGPDDVGTHVVCALMTKTFLEFTASRGNDLQTPRPEYDFPGLKPGDKWCLCAKRWKEAFTAGVAPPVHLSCTNEKALSVVRLEDLKKHAVYTH